MKRWMIALLTAWMMFGASTVWAGDVVAYVSIGGGQVVTEYVENGPAGGVSMKKSTWGTHIKAGVDLYQYTGIEVRGGMTGRINHDFPATTLGSIAPLNISAQVNGFVSYFAKLQYPITKSFKLYGLLGATTGRISVERNQGLGGALKGWKTDLSYGGGLEYKFRSRGSVGIEWVQYWKNANVTPIPPSTSSNVSLSGLSLSINKFF